MPEAEASLKDKLDPILGLIARRRWLILGSTAATALTVTGLLYQIPNRYTSEATLFVVEQQVPQRYVTPTSTTELAEALPAMTQQVLSRNWLLEIVEQFNLYPQQRRRMAPEEVVGLMRRYITIEALPPTPGHINSTGFKISFSAPTATVAQEVTSRLTSLFIQENLKTREDQAQTTTTFLRDQLEIAKQKLSKQEEILRDFKSKYLGELPEQQQGNLAILMGAQSQLQNISSGLDRAQQQRVYLETLLSGYQRLASRITNVPGGAASPQPTERPITPYKAAQADVARLQTERAKLLATFRPQYPEVLAIDREIASRQEIAEKLKPPTPEQGSPVDSKPVPGLQPPTPTAAPPNDTEEDTAIAQVKSQIESNRLEISNLLKEENQQRAMISEYQNRLNMTPVREQQLADILRGYELSKQDYADLLGKEQQSELAMTLEKRQGGQQFRLVDPPSLPQLPSSPKRMTMSLGGLGGGLALGLVVAVLAEFKRQSFYTEKEITRRFGVPIVVGLPLLISRAERRREKWLTTLEWFCGTVILAVVVIAQAWVYRHP